MGSYTWKAVWGPDYHPSMAISLGALAFSSVLAFGTTSQSQRYLTSLTRLLAVIRQILVRRNRKLDADEWAGANQIRVKEAALLEGISFEQAMERRKGFRYLY